MPFDLLDAFCLLIYADVGIVERQLLLIFPTPIAIQTNTSCFLILVTQHVLIDQIIVYIVLPLDTTLPSLRLQILSYRGILVSPEVCLSDETQEHPASTIKDYCHIVYREQLFPVS